MSTADFRRACRAYAEKYVEIQRATSSGSASSASGTTPTRRWTFSYQARSCGRSASSSSRTWSTRARSPVHWCTHCRTALAEAEVEYEPHTSPSIYVEFPMTEDSVAEFWQRGGALPHAPDRQARQSPS